jgi:hypothetical protein
MKCTVSRAFGLLPCGLVAAFALAGCEPSSALPSSTVPVVTAPPPAPGVAPGSPMMPTPPGGGAPLPGSGRVWGAAVEISSSAFTDLRGSPQVAIDDAGNAVAVWRELVADHTRNAVWASRYSAGAAWTAPITIDNSVGNSSVPQLAMAPSGMALVAFAQSASNQGGAQLLVTSRFSGTWGLPATVGTPGQNPDQPFLSVGPDGSAAVVFSASDGMFPRAWAARSSAAGAWDAPAVMESTARPGWAPSVIVTTNGDTVTTWTETVGGAAETSVWARRSHAGIWDGPVLLTNDAGAVLGSVVVGGDARGDVLAIWSQRLAGRFTLRSARMNAGTGAWSTPVTVDEGTREVTAPHLSVDASGEAVAVWFETDHGVVANRFTSSTATWGSPALLQAKSTGVAFFPVPKVGVDAEGNAVATWVQPIGSPPLPHLFAAHSAAAGGTWTAPVDLLAEPSAIPYASETKLSVNAKGEAVVVWSQDAGTPAVPGIWARVYR